MGRACGRMWRVVPCTGRRILRTESNKDIEEILKTKLATIKEEPEAEPPEICDKKRTPARLQLQVIDKSVKKKQKKKNKKGGSFVPRFSLKESWLLDLPPRVAALVY